MKDRIKQLRKELDLTQQKFADKLGVKRNTVAQWELGINALTDQVIVSICREFDVNENWLRTGEGEMKKPTSDKLSAYLGDIAIGDDDLIIEIIEAYMDLDSDCKKAIRTFVDKLAEKRMKH